MPATSPRQLRLRAPARTAALLALLLALAGAAAAAGAGTAAATPIATGDYPTCAVRVDGTVACWGDGDESPIAVNGVTGAVDVVVRGYDACVLVQSGQVGCWQVGSSSFPTVTPVGGLSDAVALTAGSEHACALRATGAVRCWGEDGFGQLGGGDGDGVAQVVSLAAGGLTTCAVRANGQASCWGHLPSVAPMPAFADARQVTLGAAHVCFLRKGGTIRCWGDNSEGQLGIGSDQPLPPPTPQDVAGIDDAIAIAAGRSHTCALRSGGTVTCWGAGDLGQLGDGAVTSRTAPGPAVSGLADAVSLGAGGASTCAVKAGGTAVCWGDDRFAQLGNGRSPISAGPVVVPGTAGALAVASRDHHACALLAVSVRCWGENGAGQLGDGTTQTRPSPVTVAGLGDATAIAAGSTHTCALTVGAGVRCWGGNSRGQLGDGTTQRSTRPVSVTGLSATQIATGYNRTCAVSSAARVVCWGDRWYTEIDGYRALTAPTVVSGTDGATAVASGSYSDCAIVAGGAVRCWGHNADGQLGNGTIGDGTHSTDPVAVTGISGATAIAAVSSKAFCARLGDGTIRCWGEGYASTPQPIAGGDLPSTAPCRLVGGGASCSGNGLWGVLGDGYQPSGHYPVQPVPAPVAGLTGVREQTAGLLPAPGDVTVGPGALAFDATVVGLESAPQVVTIANVSGRQVPLWLETSLPAGSPFTSSTTCGAVLAAAATCTVSFVFAPTTGGPQSASATISAADGAHAVRLTGPGVSGFVLTPSSVAFPATLVGAAAAPQTVTIVNASGRTRTLGLALDGVGGDFTADPSACPATLPAGGSCTIAVGFRPTAAGARSATVDVRLEGAVSALTLTGTGTVPDGDDSAPGGGGRTPGGGGGEDGGGRGAARPRAFAISGAKAARGGRIALTVTAPSAGTVRIVATARVRGKTITWHATRRPLAVGAGRRTLKLAPTKAAKQALRRVRSAKVTVRVTFTPRGGKAVVTSRTVTAKR